MGVAREIAQDDCLAFNLADFNMAILPLVLIMSFEITARFAQGWGILVRLCEALRRALSHFPSLVDQPRRARRALFAVTVDASNADTASGAVAAMAQHAGWMLIPSTHRA